MESAQLSVDAAQSAVDNFVATPDTEGTQQRSSRNTRGITVDYASMASNGRRSSSAVPLVHQPSVLEDALDKAKSKLAEKKDAHSKAVSAHEKFLQDHYVTYDDFIDLGHEIARPIIDYYKTHFISPSGDYKTFVDACMAARVLNPDVAKDMSVVEMEMCIDDLFKSLDFDEFRSASGLRHDLKDEIGTYLQLVQATTDNFWDRVDGAAEYDCKLAKLAEDEETRDEYQGKTWRDDRIETTRRVWLWWRAHFKKLPYFSQAARLVALVPITSAAVERIFSQVKFIIETTGEHGLQETLQVRLMERTNDYN